MPQPQNAKRIRPNMPDYGITDEETDGMLTWDWLDQQMAQSRNYWVCTTRADGRPHAVPVWGVWLNDTLYFGTSPTSVKGRNIARYNNVVVHLESGDDTVIIEGKLVETDKTSAHRRTIFQAYHKKYNHNPADDDTDGSIWYELQPDKIMTWLESDFLNSVAYWMFDDNT